MSQDNEIESELRAIVGSAGDDPDASELAAIAKRLRTEYRLPQPSAEGMARGRTQLMAALRADSGSTVNAASWTRRLRDAFATSNPWARLAYAGVLAVAFLLSYNSVLTISAESLPGDPLYVFKRAQEQVRFTLTFDDVQRTLLQVQFDDARVKEVEALQKQMRVERAEFSGVVEAISGRIVTVSGLALDVPAPIEISRLRAGDRVVVVVETEHDGRISVLELRKSAADAPPAMEPTATPRPTATASATASSTPRPLPTATSEPRPTETERPEDTPAPAPTQAARATATERPEATATARPPQGSPKATREPTETPRPPGATVQPTQAPESSKSPSATNTPDATKSPEATKTR